MSSNLKFMKPSQIKQSNFAKAQEVMGTTSSAVWTQHKTNEMLVEGYEGNSWVYACIHRKMQAAGSVPLVLQEYNEEDGFKDFKNDHPLKKLMNSCPGLSGKELVQMIVGQMDIQGQFFAKITYGGRGGLTPLEIYPMPIGSCSAVEIDGEAKQFKYMKRDGRTETLEAKEVLHIKDPHPDTIFRGMAPLKAGGKAVDVDNEAANWQKISMQNRGIPDGVFTMTGDIGPDEWEEASRQVSENYTGIENSRKPWVVANAKFEQMSQSMADLDFMQGRKMTREEICAVLDVPPPLVGILDKANYSNIETARKIFWIDSMIPKLSLIADQITSKFVKPNEKLRMVFDTSKVDALQESLTEKLTSAKDLFGMGVPLTVINKKLEMNLGIEEIQGLNVGYLPGALMPTTFASTPGASKDKNQSTDEVGEDSSSRMSDEDFDRISSVMDKVITNQMTREAAIKLLNIAIPYLDVSKIEELIPVVEVSNNAD